MKNEDLGYETLEIPTRSDEIVPLNTTLGASFFHQPALNKV